MKLIYCSECQDVIRLDIKARTNGKPRRCRCGKASGYYEDDGMNAVICGSTSVPFAIENLDLQMHERAAKPHCAPIMRAWFIVPGVFDYPEIRFEP